MKTQESMMLAVEGFNKVRPNATAEEGHAFMILFLCAVADGLLARIVELEKRPAGDTHHHHGDG